MSAMGLGSTKAQVTSLQTCPRSTSAGGTNDASSKSGAA